jgi:hypothetical protein
VPTEGARLKVVLATLPVLRCAKLCLRGTEAAHLKCRARELRSQWCVDVLPVQPVELVHQQLHKIHLEATAQGTDQRNVRPS